VIETYFFWKKLGKFSQTLKYSEKGEKSEMGEMHHWLWEMDTPALSCKPIGVECFGHSTSIALFFYDGVICTSPPTLPSYPD